MGEFTQKQIEIYQKNQVKMYRRTHPEAKDLAYEALADMFVITPEELITIKNAEVVKIKEELDEETHEMEDDQRLLEEGHSGMALTELYHDIASSKLIIAELKRQLKTAINDLQTLREENPDLGIADTHGR